MTEDVMTALDAECQAELLTAAIEEAQRHEAIRRWLRQQAWVMLGQDEEVGECLGRAEW